MKEATLGAGCFWCIEACYKDLKGVISVTSGYAGGHVDHPTYKQICNGDTGHAEVARVVYDELRKYALHTYPNGFQLNNPHGIENSCTVANALDEMLCMSVGNVIRLFAGLPDGHDAEFKNLRAWGAFLVSARRADGRIAGVRIESEKGKVCTIVNPWPGKTVRVMRGGKAAGSVSGLRLRLDTRAGEIVDLQQE